MYFVCPCSVTGTNAARSSGPILRSTDANILRGPHSWAADTGDEKRMDANALAISERAVRNVMARAPVVSSTARKQSIHELLCSIKGRPGPFGDIIKPT